MNTYKIFVYDTLCLGFPDSITYLKDQTFHFTAKTTKNYMMFYSGNVYLVKNNYGRECFGEIFEVSETVLNRIRIKKSKKEYYEETIIVTDTVNNEKHKVITWLYDINKLRKKNFKCISINCFRDMSPALSGKKGLEKTCC